MVRALIDGGGDVNAREDQDSRAPLHYVSREGHTETVHALINGGGDVNAPNDWDQSPLGQRCWGLRGRCNAHGPHKRIDKLYACSLLCTPCTCMYIVVHHDAFLLNK